MIGMTTIDTKAGVDLTIIEITTTDAMIVAVAPTETEHHLHHRIDTNIPALAPDFTTITNEDTTAAISKIKIRHQPDHREQTAMRHVIMNHVSIEATTATIYSDETVDHVTKSTTIENDDSQKEEGPEVIITMRQPEVIIFIKIIIWTYRPNQSKC